MAIVKPFKAIRPARDKAKVTAALPYDVYNRAEAKEVVANNPESFLAIDRAETQFDDSVSTYADCVYEKAASLLKEFIDKKQFIEDTQNCFYIYRLIMDGRSQTGIVGLSSIDDYQNQVIKKHENTREEKEQDRIRHIDTCNAQTGPIFLAYRAQETIRQLVDTATNESSEYQFVSDDGIEHIVWVVKKQEVIDALVKAFANIDHTYIADGHHRAASAVKVGLKRRNQAEKVTGEEEFNYFLSVLFPDEELMVMPYNRVVKDLNGLTKETFLEKIGENFEIEEVGKTAYEPIKKYEIGMFLDDMWYRLIAKDSIKNSDPVKGLDVSLLQDFVLAPLLGIDDPRTDNRIDFIGGIRGTKELEKRCHNDMTVAFSMYATSIQELFSVADADLLMPPKSTWFEPKLRSGLFVHAID